MKFYLMNPKREYEIIDWYGHEILYINKKPRIFNYVENCSYWFGGNLNSEYYKWTEVSDREEMIIHRSGSYYKGFALVNGCTVEDLEKDMKVLKKFRNLVKKEIK